MKTNAPIDLAHGHRCRAVAVAAGCILALASASATATATSVPATATALANAAALSDATAPIEAGALATANAGARTSFHFRDIPVRSALQLIAEEGRFNLVVSDSVQGNITLRLSDVTWEQALDVVLRIKGLAQHVDGNTRSVGTASD